jgi:DNA-binding MarR family transcriptional regulator
MAPCEARLLDSIIGEVRSLFHLLRASAVDLHGLGPSSAGLRGVLESIAENGPQTVPQIARSRPVSRQHIQMLVNDLIQRGLVHLVDNPAHKRSRLVDLTEEGRLAHRRMRQIEERLLSRLPITASERELQTTASVLRQLREAIGKPAWRESVRNTSVGRKERGKRS